MKTLTATFDIGTTAVKGVLVDDRYQILRERAIALTTYYDHGQIEQAPEDWYTAFCQISQEFAAGLMADESIEAVVMSGQMQDTIGLDSSLRPVGRAILYSDGRATVQAQKLNGLIGQETMAAVTGNVLDGAIPFAKLLYLAEAAPQIYQQMAKVVFSAKDYVIACLTGEAITDLTTAATTGLMDITRHIWCDDWLTVAGLEPALLPRLCAAEELVGVITDEAAKACGLSVGTAVYAGCGDAGAATLASGIAAPGEININLGTSGWVAAISQRVLSGDGVFNLVAASHDYCINVVPFLNAGNVHQWAAVTYAQGSYDTLQQMVEASTAGAGGVFFLPYLVGERYPVMDSVIRAGYLGITAETTAADLARSALEGVAFSIRQGLASLPHQPAHISMIGGGAQDLAWCRLLSDVLGRPIMVHEKSQYLPAMALAAIAHLAQGIIGDYQDIAQLIKQQVGCTIYQPSPDRIKTYDRIYQRYLQLYPVMKAFYTD